MPTSEEIQAELQVILFEASAAFDQLCSELLDQDSNAEGGELTFLEEDVINAALNDLANLVNNSRRQAVKLILLREQLALLPQLGLATSVAPPSLQVGAKSFISSKGTEKK